MARDELSQLFSLGGLWATDKPVPVVILQMVSHSHILGQKVRVLVELVTIVMRKVRNILLF